MSAITIQALVATTPRHLVTEDGLPITSFRVAVNERVYNTELNKWIDGHTNWYTVTCFRQLAINAIASISKGERVIVTGKLMIRDWDNGERAGTTVEIEAASIGHDLTWGQSTFKRTVLVRENADMPVVVA